MKSKVKILVLLVVAVANAPGQNCNYGIYKTPQDYEERKLFCAVNSDSSAGKIKLHDFFPENYVDVIKNGKKYRFCKDSIFGYRDRQKKDYRFYKSYSREYQVLESRAITIYKAEVAVTNAYGKKTGLAPAYFFSLKIDSDIMPLTLANLEQAFPANLKFQCLLCCEFRYGTTLSEYSSKDNMYKINAFLYQANLQ